MKKGINFKMKMEYCKGYSSYYLVEDSIDTYMPLNEEFYNIPVPSEDIWKKFELLPTPPRSPIHESEHDDPTERLLKVTNLLDDSADSFHVTFGISDIYSGLLPAQVQMGLKNDLLHDCMWSGSCWESCKKKNAHNRTSDIDDVKPTPLQLSSRSATPSSGTGTNPEQCVDPSSVLPYTPLSDHSYHQATQLTTRVAVCSEIERIQTPTTLGGHLGSDTPSDSDDEDDEIDVVGYPPQTVHKNKQCLQRKGASQLSSKVTSHSKPTKRHSDIATLGEGKKLREEKLKRTICRYSSSSRSSSDSEDCEKRSQHNSMERKRRDDLRYAFQTLRENVPDLKDKPKAPKILILNQAATYVHQLTTTGQNLERTLKQEAKRRHELQRRLLQLQRTKF